MGILTLLYLACLAFLLWVTHSKRAWYTRAKAATSALFLLCGVWAALAGSRNSPFALVLLLAGLVLCAGGDILLGLANRTKKLRAKPFVAGAVLFALAHVLFCCMLFLRCGVRWFDALLPAVCLLLMWLFEKRDIVRLKNMRALAYVYTLLVALMATKAVCAGMTLGLIPGLALAGGGLLFFISDVILLFLYFGVPRHRLLRYANLTTYYMGVYLLAISAYWL